MSTHLVGSTQLKKTVAALAGAALVAGTWAVAAPALADTPNFDSWVEEDDPAPFDTVQGLVFYKAAGINFGDATLDGNGLPTALEDLVPLADLDGLGYTVAQSSSWAPSYQIGIANTTTGVTYARLVWEPYQQEPSQGPNTGTFTDLEDGLWWGNRVFTSEGGTSPFGTGDGSQSKPQQLDFFEERFGSDTQVVFFGVKQGTTTDSTSTVTSLTFEGHDVPLGDPDPTPFDSADVTTQVDAATAPLQSQITDLQSQLASLNSAKAKLQADFNAYKASHPVTSSEATAGYVNTAAAAKAKWNLVDKSALTKAENATKTQQAKAISISGTKAVGKKVSVKRVSISGASVKYQWYVGGKKVKGATKSSLKLTRSQAGKSLSVKVTTSWKDAAGKKHSVSTTASYLRTAYIKK